jgi:Zn finger protein HypA/HybF involved in hydrogenase expression
MSDVVYCNLCFNEWFKDEWGVICPHCENESTEVVSATLQRRQVGDRLRLICH